MMIDELVMVPNVEEAIVPVGEVVSIPKELVPELNWVNDDVALEQSNSLACHLQFPSGREETVMEEVAVALAEEVAVEVVNVEAV